MAADAFASALAAIAKPYSNIPRPSDLSAAIGYGPHGLGFAMSDTAKGIMMSFCLIAA